MPSKKKTASKKTTEKPCPHCDGLLVNGEYPHAPGLTADQCDKCKYVVSDSIKPVNE